MVLFSAEFSFQAIVREGEPVTHTGVGVDPSMEPRPQHPTAMDGLVPPLQGATKEAMLRTPPLMGNRPPFPYNATSHDIQRPARCSTHYDLSTTWQRVATNKHLVSFQSRLDKKLKVGAAVQHWVPGIALTGRRQPWRAAAEPTRTYLRRPVRAIPGDQCEFLLRNTIKPSKT